jgi:hypothetical protein
MHNLSNIWREISSWTPEERLALAKRILQSLQQDEAAVTVSQERRAALQQLIGTWKTEQPPNDEEVERILEQERMKKYG